MAGSVTNRAVIGHGSLKLECSSANGCPIGSSALPSEKSAGIVTSVYEPHSCRSGEGLHVTPDPADRLQMHGSLRFEGSADVDPPSARSARCRNPVTVP